MSVHKDETMHTTADDAEFAALMAASSLGSPHVRALAATIPDEVKRQLRATSTTASLDDDVSQTPQEAHPSGEGSSAHPGECLRQLPASAADSIRDTGDDNAVTPIEDCSQPPDRNQLGSPFDWPLPVRIFDCRMSIGATSEPAAAPYVFLADFCSAGIANRRRHDAIVRRLATYLRKPEPSTMGSVRLRDYVRMSSAARLPNVPLVTDGSAFWHTALWEWLSSQTHRPAVIQRAIERLNTRVAVWDGETPRWSCDVAVPAEHDVYFVLGHGLATPEAACSAGRADMESAACVVQEQTPTSAFVPHNNWFAVTSLVTHGVDTQPLMANAITTRHHSAFAKRAGVTAAQLTDLLETTQPTAWIHAHLDPGNKSTALDQLTDDLTRRHPPTPDAALRSMSWDVDASVQRSRRASGPHGESALSPGHLLVAAELAIDLDPARRRAIPIQPPPLPDLQAYAAQPGSTLLLPRENRTGSASSMRADRGNAPVRVDDDLGVGQAAGGSRPEPYPDDERPRMWSRQADEGREQHAELWMSLHQTENDTGERFPARLIYRTADRFAVTAVFNAGLDDERTWQFARELLADGLQESVGVGDVIVWPGPAERVFIRLRPPESTALLSLAREDAAAFLDASELLVGSSAADTKTTAVNTWERELMHLMCHGSGE
ncbi:SsgA family sporulation/cell division regulator [Streptomyces sp. MI02-7b]|uniref:SsgA family sporulation/cell division regulator n=1 Tax=Streptomyces sp. MI02-7b TaxID=462941 RepID=UPI0029ACF0D3|nr:SsgA family sporulation/cell division regulator [Streptomyces sp. MI02-7b]MDX3078433.1 SsgA family sporulation/cell division regulator [Streptomyces sp. MI02-7b]